MRLRLSQPQAWDWAWAELGNSHDSDLGGGISISSLNILIGPSSPSPLHADITIEYYDFQLSDISIFRGTHFVFLDTILSVYISY